MKHLQQCCWIILISSLFLLSACTPSNSGAAERLPVITSLHELDSAILMTWQVWPEDERGSYFAQFAFDPDDEPYQVYRWRINIQAQGKCRTKWFDWSQVDDMVRFYCGRGIYLQPAIAKPGELFPAPEIPETEEGWIEPPRNGSPDGVYLLYEIDDMLMVINTQTRQSKEIDLPTGVDHITAKWAPDGKSFVSMVQHRDSGHFDVFRISRDDWQAKPLEGIQLTSRSRELSWSNDGASLLYGQADNKGASLWIYDFATETADSIFGFSNEESDIGVHAWSPDDQRIVFISSFDTLCQTNDEGIISCDRKMYIIDRDGQNLREIPDLGEQDDLAWVE